MSSTSNASLSGSSAAANTVVVTARDIEFSNYNRSTNKWGGAVMTMMIMDAVTEDLEGYDERVYAVFRNHEDPTDLIEFSSEVDGLDTRVTTTDPMVPSAKYELYKIYGATSGDEYATSSEFYFQTPGRLWDFANDTVGQNDITLVSDWFNYGYVETANGDKYGVVDADGFGVFGFPGQYDTPSTVTVNGETIQTSDIVKVKMTSLCEGDIYNTTNNITYYISYFYGMSNLIEIDFVAARITAFRGKRESSGSLLDVGWQNCSLFDHSGINRGDGNGKRFAFPETLVYMPKNVLAGYYMGSQYYNQYGTFFNSYHNHIYMPDSVRYVGNGFAQYCDTIGHKIRLSPNLYSVGDNFLAMSSYDTSPPDGYPYYYHYSGDITIPSTLATIGKSFMSGFVIDGDIKLPNSVQANNSNTAFMSHVFAKSNLNKAWVLPAGISTFSGWDNVSGSSWDINNGSLTTFSGLNNLYINGSFQNQNVIPFTSAIEWELPEGVTSTNGQCFVNAFAKSISLPSTLTSIGDYFCGYSSWHDHWNDVPDSRMELVKFNQNSNVRTIGNYFLAGLYVTKKGLEITFPSGITSIGSYFLSRFYGTYFTGSGGYDNHIIVDFRNVSPNVVSDNTANNTWMTNFFDTDDCYFIVKTSQNDLAAWMKKLPRIYGNNSYRVIKWEPDGVTFGVAFYKTNISDSTYKTATIRTQQEFESLCYSGTSTANRSITLDNGQVTINTASGQNILCGAFVGDGITTIPDGFLSCCPNLEILEGMFNVTTIGDNFLYKCENFDYEFTAFARKVVTIGDNFLAGCTSFNKNILNKMDQRYSYSTHRLTGTLRYIGDNFLKGCTSFNNGGAGIQLNTITIGDSFLEGCTSLSNVNLYYSAPSTPANVYSDRSIGNNFLKGCTAFDGTLNGEWSIHSLGDNFLQGCTSFNNGSSSGSMSIRAAVFGNNFMQGCVSYAKSYNMYQHIELISVGWGFFNGCDSFTSFGINANNFTISDIDKFDNDTSNGYPSFATTNPNATAFVNGMNISTSESGSSHPLKDAFLDRFPNMASQGQYRNFIGGTPVNING